MTRGPITGRINAAGRAVWFTHAADDRSTVHPIAREGVVAFVLALLLVLGGGTAMMVVVLLTQNFWWIPVGFAVVALGLAAFAIMVSRHLP